METDIEKQIANLKIILFWTESQATFLKASIAALEAQQVGYQTAQDIWEPWVRTWFPFMRG